MSSGLCTSVEVRYPGSHLVADVAAGVDALPVDQVSAFSETGGRLLVDGLTLDYTGVDVDTDEVFLGFPLQVPVSADDPVSVLHDDGSAWVEHVANVSLDEDGDDVPATIPTALVGYFVEGFYDPPVRVEVSLDSGTYVVSSRPGQSPVFDGSVIDPATLPAMQPPPPPDPPLASPAPSVRGGIGALVVSWPEVGGVLGVTVDVYVSVATPVPATAANLVASVAGGGRGLLFVRSLTDGTPVVAGTTYHVVTSARNVSGTAPVSVEASGSPGLVTSTDVAANLVTSNMLVTNSALIDALQVTGIDAGTIRTGVLNALRLSVGAVTVSALDNSQFEDPVVAADGTVNPDSFAGWMLASTVAGTSLAAQTAAPIGGTRSARVTLADAVASQRLISSRSKPVTGGQRYEIAAKVKATRTVDTSAATGSPVATLTMHTAAPGGDPSVPPQASPEVIWTDVVLAQTLAAGVATDLSGVVSVPAGHTLMRCSITATGPNDAGAGWSLDVDEFYARPAQSGFTITDPATGGTSAEITDQGDATFHDVTMEGALFTSADAIDLGGISLADTLAALPRADLASGSITVNIAGITGTRYGLIELPVDLPDDALTRNYHVTVAGYFLASQAGSTVTLDVRDSGAAVPTATGPQLETPSSFLQQLMPANSNTVAVTGAFIWRPTTLGRHRLLLTCRSLQGGTAGISALYTASIIVADGGARTANTGIANTGGGVLATGGSNTTPTPVPETQTYTRTFNATTSSWFKGSGPKSGANPDSNFFGNPGSVADGRRATAIWFDDAAIRTALAGATITQIEFYAYLFNGGSNRTVTIGMHGDSIVRTNYFDILGRTPDIQRSANWDSGSSRWVTLPTTQGFATGNVRGVLLTAPSDAAVYTGGIYSAARTHLYPRVRITYQK
ncbi:MAG: hypothetical protein ACR2JO_08110 [Mycobacteriales bacterium]